MLCVAVGILHFSGTRDDMWLSSLPPDKIKWKPAWPKAPSLKSRQAKFDIMQFTTTVLVHMALSSQRIGLVGNIISQKNREHGISISVFEFVSSISLPRQPELLQCTTTSKAYRYRAGLGIGNLDIMG